MQDISLHLLDIVQNSIRAQASEVKIQVIEAVDKNFLKLIISDNGKGMSALMVNQVMNPFITTRTLRRVGLGIPFLHQNCVNAGGNLKIESEEGKGTLIEAIMQYNHIDRLPLGDIAESLGALIEANPKVEFSYQHLYQQKKFSFQTTEVKRLLQDIPIHSPEIIKWIRVYIKESLNVLHHK